MDVENFLVISSLISIVVCPLIMREEDSKPWRGVLIGLIVALSAGVLGLIGCLYIHFRKKPSKCDKMRGERFGNSDDKNLETDVSDNYICNAVIDPLTREACEDQTNDSTKVHCDYKLTDADMFCPMCGFPNKKMKNANFVKREKAVKRKEIPMGWYVAILIILIISLVFGNLTHRKRVKCEQQLDELIHNIRHQNHMY